MQNITEQIHKSKAKSGSFINIPPRFVERNHSGKRTIEVFKDVETNYYVWNGYGCRKYRYPESVILDWEDGIYVVSEEQHQEWKKKK